MIFFPRHTIEPTTIIENPRLHFPIDSAVSLFLAARLEIVVSNYDISTRYLYAYVDWLFVLSRLLSSDEGSQVAQWDRIPRSAETSLKRHLSCT